MKKDQLKHILRNAVLLALPATTQMGCVSAPVVVDPPKSTDPCRDPAVRSPGQATIDEKIYQSGSDKLSADECVKLCQQLVKKQYSHEWSALVGMENFKVSQCTTRVDPKTYDTSLQCTANFTEVNSAYTYAPGCYSPPRPAVGRMPAGLHVHPQTAASELGSYFADMAAMETAAITAFRYLVRELTAYQAPVALIRLAQAAIEEETRHAQMAGLLSQACDTAVPVVEVADFQLRSLFDIALENAIEGCVNETFAAACGLWQEQHAESEVFRQVIGHIAEEEVGHAALSWSIHEWAIPQLTLAQQAHIRQAQAEAVETLAQKFLREETPLVRRAVGLPQQADAAHLFQQLRTQLWDERIA
ncbi:MAG: hypothetical protein BWK73_46465 [Thiothrix lacustris]|uniref:Ferritin n=1 Tax=Thiothrix lacustris TaxID=525917 RepID=A0A1Y1QAN7_9GAMM|nr:MAG: hypothetical protein BWK73_46465 [Thiothrix lacustris]